MTKSKNNRKNWAVRIAIISFALALITCCLMGSTIAKYTTSVTGSSTSDPVASWAWEIDGTALSAGSTSYTFNLFDTVKEADATTAEENVAADKIAPGTGGKFSFTVANKSDVDATYAVNYTITNTLTSRSSSPQMELLGAQTLQA